MDRSKEEKADGFFVRNKSAIIMGLAALIIAATADLIAGLFLTSMEDYLLTITGMMILIYCAIGMRGNIFGSMGSRLGTSMHMGTFKMTFKKNSVLRSNIEAALALTLSLSIAMGVAGWIVTELCFGPTIDLSRYVFISLVGGLLAGIVVVIFNVAIAYIGFKRDWDVDNITAPLIAAAGDIATVPMIFLATLAQDAIEQDWIIYAVCIVLTIVTVYIMVKILGRKTRRRKRMNEAKRILIQSTPVLLVCMLFEILAGVVIQTETDNLVQYGVLLVLLPAFLNEGNALSGMLTSRLSSMLHLGTLAPKAVPQKAAVENFMLIYLLAAVTFLLIGSAAYGVQPDTLAYGLVIAIVMIAGMLTTSVINILSYYVAIAAIKFHLDPDDHCIPITSSVMDVVGTVILVAVIGFML